MGVGETLSKIFIFIKFQEVEHDLITEMASVIIRFVVSDNLTLSSLSRSHVFDSEVFYFLSL